jgi:hypothetical protein
MAMGDALSKYIRKMVSAALYFPAFLSQQEKYCIPVFFVDKISALSAFLLHVEHLLLLLENSKWKFEKASLNTSCLPQKRGLVSS